MQTFIKGAQVTRRARLFIIVGLTVGLVGILLVWRTARDGEFAPDSSLLPPSAHPAPFAPSPLAYPAATLLYSPLPTPSAILPLVNTATLEAIRATRPTATPPSPSSIRLPYVSPATWRQWALRLLAAAGVLAYISLRLRRNQKT